MKLLLLTVCCVISTSIAGPFSQDKERKLETALNDIEALLQDVKESDYNSDLPKPRKYFGDLPKPKMDEILLYTENSKRAIAEIERMGGRVPIAMGHNVLIASVPSDIATKQDAFAHSSPSFPASASERARSYARAYEKYLQDINGPQPEVQKWTEKTAPKGYPRPSPFANAHAAPTLRGRIAVGQITVSGPGTSAISAEEESTVSAEVIRGLKFWTDNAPADANLSFNTFGGFITIDAPNATAGCDPCHDSYVGPVLDVLGFSSNEELAEAIKRDTPDATGSFLAYFTRYYQHHFAYAYFNGGPSYMQFKNDGWGPAQIDRVFAHETGHVFNAPDEYTSCNCGTNYGRGTCTAKNANCAQSGKTSCTTAQQACIMDENDINNICDNSKKHVGWC